MAGKRISAGGIVVRVLVVIALAVAIYYVWQWRTAGPVAQLKKVQVGDDRQQVIALMGPPDRETAAFPLPGEEDLAEKAAKADAETWLLWESALGVQCVVGLGSDGTVAYKANTGT